MSSGRTLRLACLSVATLLVAGCGGGGGSGGDGGPQRPTVTIQSVAPTSPWATVPATFVASGSSPQGGTLTYAWSFGDGSTGTGASVQHAYAAAGAYTVSVTATDTASLTSQATRTVTVALPTPTGVAIDGNALTGYVGEGLFFLASATDPAGLPITYAWDFGDSTTATGDWAMHWWTASGTYTVRLRATNSVQGAAERTATVTVLAIPATVAGANDALVPYCSGPLCGAASATTYSGPGLGVWRYHNSTGTAARVDVRLGGVSAGQQVTLVLSNANPGPVAVAAPWPGLHASAAASTEALRAVAGEPVDPRDAAHADMARRNHEMALRIAALPRVVRNGAPAAIGPPAPRATPAVGDTRNWTDTFGATATYATRVHATCAVPGGRDVVFWIDPNALGVGKVTEEMLLLLEGKFCGPTGGVARTVALLGDVWGPAANAIPEAIHDPVGGLLDVNVVILGVPPGTPWGGYVDSTNALLKSSAPTSNEALVFMVNGVDLPNSPPYYVSVLVHELTHMVNLYQRTVLHQTAHDLWVEEMTALMSEDIVAPAVNDATSFVFGRVTDYAQSGGAVNLEAWPPGEISYPHYAMAGTLGAFLNRRYGLSIYTGLASSCTDPATLHDGHACLDQLIRGAGGLGYADELDRAGASAFARLPGELLPWGFGFPERIVPGYELFQFPVSLVPPGLPPAPSIVPTFPATSQVFVEDVVSAGATTYARTGVSVPPGTTLLVLVR
jgi:PKD repeat protein